SFAFASQPLGNNANNFSKLSVMFSIPESIADLQRFVKLCAYALTPQQGYKEEFNHKVHQEHEGREEKASSLCVLRALGG
ncbi:hypothetical protein ACYULU_10260, partial [Breznakiellaceae bacterium SP9]